MLNLGIIGAGRIGQLHANNVANNIPDVKLSGICDVVMTDEIKKWAEGIGAGYVSDNPDDIINDESVDAILICSSTDTHTELIIKAAKAGKDIFCEKPIGSDIDEINEALKVVEETGVKLQLGFVRRFDHNHKKVREVVESGKIGDPHIVRVSSRDPEPPPIEYVKRSGGLFFDMMIHDFDMVRFLSGSEVTEVHTIGSAIINPEVAKYDDVDTAIVTLKFANGAIGVIDNSRASNYGYDQRVEVHGSLGAVEDSNDYASTMKLSTREGTFADLPKWFFLERYNDAFIDEVKAFVEAIVTDSDPVVNGNDGLQPVLIAQAAKKSLDEGRSVKISELI